MRPGMNGGNRNAVEFIILGGESDASEDEAPGLPAPSDDEGTTPADASQGETLCSPSFGLDVFFPRRSRHRFFE